MIIHCGLMPVQREFHFAAKDPENHGIFGFDGIPIDSEGIQDLLPTRNHFPRSTINSAILGAPASRRLYLSAGGTPALPALSFKLALMGLRPGLCCFAGQVRLNGI
jgi:hypothetical protein